MKLSEAIKIYINYLKYEKNASESTIYNYWLYLRRILDYLWDKNIKYIKPIDLINFREHLSKNLNIKTINLHIIAFRSLLKFLIKKNILNIRFEWFELWKTNPRNINFLNEEEIEKILKAPEDEKNELKRIRDSLILHLLFWSWLRVSELINLKLKNIDLKTWQFYITWKWKKQRACFLTKQALNLLIEYINIKPNSEYLITWLKTNNKLTRMSIRNIVNYYAKKAGIEKKVTPHVLRHTFATTLLKKWADIRSVQILLWHSNITTTQIYTHIEDSHLRNIHNLLN